jgi:hypothetical protein
MKYLSHISLIFVLTLLFACKKENTKPSPAPTLVGKWTLKNERIVEYNGVPGTAYAYIDTLNFKTGVFVTKNPLAQTPIIDTLENYIQFNADSTFVNVNAATAFGTVELPNFYNSDTTKHRIIFDRDSIRSIFKLIGSKLVMPQPIGLENDDAFFNDATGNSGFPFQYSSEYNPKPTPQSDPDISITELSPTNLTLHTDYTYTWYLDNGIEIIYPSSTNVNLRLVTDYYYAR